MSDSKESLKQSIDYYDLSSKYNTAAAHLSTVISIGMGAMAGMGIILVLEGKPLLGTLATGVGGVVSWLMANEALDETLQAYKDEQVLEQYTQRLASFEAPTEGLG